MIEGPQCWTTDYFLEICCLSSYLHTRVWYKPIKTKFNYPYLILQFVSYSYIFFQQYTFYFLSQVSHLSNNIAPFGFLVFASLHTVLFILHTTLFILLVIKKDLVGRRDDSQVMFCWGSSVDCKSGKPGRVLQRLWCLIPLIVVFL